MLDEYHDAIKPIVKNRPEDFISNFFQPIKLQKNPKNPK